MADLKDFFSEKEIQRLQLEWKIIHDKSLTEVGVKLLLRIFEYEPMVQQAFPPLQGMQPNELSANSVFRSHALRFMLVTDKVVKKLNSDAEVVPHIKQVGEKHKKVEGFHGEYLKYFVPAMEEIWEQELGAEVFDEESRHMWGKIFRLITGGVEQGRKEALGHVAA